MGFPNPSIAGAAIVEALDPNQATAHHQDADEAQAALDEADLRAVEQAEYYSETMAEPATAPAGPRRSLLDRLRRR